MTAFLRGTQIEERGCVRFVLTGAGVMLAGGVVMLTSIGQVNNKFGVDWHPFLGGIMAIFKVRMQQRRGVKTEIEFEVHASSEDEARKTAASKFPVHDVIAIKKLETPSHDLSVKVAATLLGLAKQSKSPHIKAIGIFAKPIAEVAVNIKEAVERRVKNGETSVDDIARSIFDQLLPD